jgi:hypothetical protein
MKDLAKYTCLIQGEMFVAKKANIGSIHDCFKRSVLFKPFLIIENPKINIDA